MPVSQAGRSADLRFPSHLAHDSDSSATPSPDRCVGRDDRDFGLVGFTARAIMETPNGNLSIWRNNFLSQSKIRTMTELAHGGRITWVACGSIPRLVRFWTIRNARMGTNRDARK